ncbi:MAG: DUF3990 domain-containing protein [Lachnospiraceae bacterium]|nr:DUF3990 domain-containing protein [Lachnospiraceae bacterium]
MLKLYHTGFSEIKAPDIHYGRKNADFGQGFYTSADIEFSKKWAKSRKDEVTVLNCYELKEDGLKIKRLTRDREWFSYIYGNRRLRDDPYKDYDVIIGPIANDTIYDTLGITTSGYLSEEEAMKILMLGPCYEQIVLKTENAARALIFLSSEIIPIERITEYRKEVKKEEQAFQEEMAKVLEG